MRPGLCLLHCIVPIAMLFAKISSALATDYYVASAGDDAQHGDSPAAAWRSIERINRAVLSPGDRVLFAGGQSFAGQLKVKVKDGGSPNAPVTIGSFGGQQATISAGAGTGITCENFSGIVIENLVIVGAGRTNNSGWGIRCDNTLPERQMLTNLVIRNVDASGFGVFGILIAGDRAGFANVCVTNCSLHDNLRGGMEIAGRLPWDSPEYCIKNVQVTHCKAFNNTGDPGYLKNHSGSGIVLYQVDEGVIENCTAWNNGGLCRSSGGGVGLWLCASRRATIQHCESFANRTSGGDGGGFDLDGGCVDCTLQYNYSHDNDGPGLMICSYQYAQYSDKGSVIRFNVSENDSRKGRRYAGLWIQTGGREITGAEIYNNTVVIGDWTGQAAWVDGNGLQATFCNNLFVSSGAAIPLRVDEPAGRLRFANNLYWRDGGPVHIQWGTNLFATLESWRAATAQETIANTPSGLFCDPKLAIHPPGIDTAREIGIPKLLAWRPLKDSPVLLHGVSLKETCGIDAGLRDLLGAPIPSKPPLGAISGSR